MKIRALQKYARSSGRRRRRLATGNVMYLLVLLSVFFHLPSAAQETLTVRGRTMDERAQPIASTSVTVKETTAGTTTILSPVL
jgi:hypothetical protein